jgi:GxxExxY protein
MTQSASRMGYDFSDLSYVVIGACQDVQRQLGVHCMEVDYQRALEIALSKWGISWQREVEIPIVYDGIVVTKRRVDFIIGSGNDQLIMETNGQGRRWGRMGAQEYLTSKNTKGFGTRIARNGAKDATLVHEARERPCFGEGVFRISRKAAKGSLGKTRKAGDGGGRGGCTI